MSNQMKIVSVVPNTVPYLNLIDTVIPISTRTGDTLFDAANGDSYVIRGILMVANTDGDIATIGLTLVPVNQQL